MSLDLFFALIERIKNAPSDIIYNDKIIMAKATRSIIKDWAITIPAINDSAINKVGLKLIIFFIRDNNNIKKIIKNVNEYVANY